MDNTDINLEKLLKKYIQHVSYWEGTDFISDEFMVGTHFSEAEKFFLKQLSKENEE